MKTTITINKATITLPLSFNEDMLIVVDNDYFQDLAKFCGSEDIADDIFETITFNMNDGDMSGDFEDFSFVATVDETKKAAAYDVLDFAWSDGHTEPHEMAADFMHSDFETVSEYMTGISA